MYPITTQIIVNPLRKIHAYISFSQFIIHLQQHYIQ